MVVKNIPTVYAPAPKQSPPDIVDELLYECAYGNGHGGHPCGHCLHCAARSVIVKLRKYVRYMENKRG